MNCDPQPDTGTMSDKMSAEDYIRQNGKETDWDRGHDTKIPRQGKLGLGVNRQSAERRLHNRIQRPRELEKNLSVSRLVRRVHE